MSEQTVTKIEAAVVAWRTEDFKATNGNKAAGTRARAHLADLMKLAKARRVEIQSAKIAAKAE